MKKIELLAPAGNPEALKAAEAVASVIYLARTGSSLQEIRSFVVERYYPLNFTLDSIRPNYRFDVSCQGSVPQAFEAFFESVSFEDAIRNAVSIGGDSDTIAAITGSMAEAYFGIPGRLRRHASVFLNDECREVINRFEKRFGFYREDIKRISAAKYALDNPLGVRVGRHLPGQTDYDLEQKNIDFLYQAAMDIWPHFTRGDYIRTGA